MTIWYSRFRPRYLRPLPAPKSAKTVAILCTVLALAAVADGIHLRRWLEHRAGENLAQLPGDELAREFSFGERVYRDARGPGAKADLPSWGSVLAGCFNLYARADHKDPAVPGDLDLSPARLLAVCLWVRALHSGQPAPMTLPTHPAVALPLAMANTVFELAAAVLTFSLVRFWLQRGQQRAPTFAPMLLAFLAAALTWFSPALLLDGHLLPNTESWLMPGFLGAALLGSRGKYLWAGAALGVGTFCDQRLMLVSPLFLLWPFFDGGRRPAVRVLVGWLAATIILGAPWWMHGMIAYTHIALFSSFRLPAEMTAGASNLPTLLAAKPYGWRPQDTISIPHVVTIRIGVVLVAAFELSLVYCAGALVLNSRRRDPRALVALAGPWVLAFALLPGQPERPITWAATFTALAVGASLGAPLVHLALALLAGCLLAQDLLSRDPGLLPGLSRFVAGFHPNAAWAITLLAGVMLFAAPPRQTRAEDPNLEN